MFQFDTIKSVGGSQCPGLARDHIDLTLTDRTGQYIVYGRRSYNCNEQLRSESQIETVVAGREERGEERSRHSTTCLYSVLYQPGQPPMES